MKDAAAIADQAMMLATRAKKLFAGKGSDVTGAALCELVALHLAAHIAPNDPEATEELRAMMLETFVSTVKLLCSAPRGQGNPPEARGNAPAQEAELSEFHTPENEARIDRLYAFMSVDENGHNGIVAHVLPNLGSTPLVTGSRRVALKMIPMAEAVAKLTGKKVILYVFNRAESYDLWQSE